MLYYSQTKGEWTNAAGLMLVSGCYAGMGPAKNDPGSQRLKNAGPLPQGVYTLGHLQHFGHLGPAMPLVPDVANQMFGRAGFYVHLDNPAHIGYSSDGCIVCQNDAAMTGFAKLEALERLRLAGETHVTVTA